MPETRKVDNNKIRNALFVNLCLLDMMYQPTRYSLLRRYSGSTGV